jgi:misacylated tRNA(Ala) deacylase
LNNLQLFLLPHTDALARSNTSTARLYFLCGPRLINYLTTTHNFLASTASILSCGAPLVPERVSQVVEERKKAEKRVDELETEVAKGLARDLTQKLIPTSEDALLLKAHIHRTDDSLNPLNFLNAVAFALSAAPPEPGTKPYVVVLSSSPSSQSSSSITTILVFGSAEAKVKEIGDALKAKLNVKGGGKGPRWSGKFIGVWREAKESKTIDEIMASV